MSDDPNRVVVLVTIPTEVQAKMIVAALEYQGVQARTTGALTSAFRAEVPGGAQVIILQADLEQAQAILRAIEEESDSE